MQDTCDYVTKAVTEAFAPLYPTGAFSRDERVPYLLPAEEKQQPMRLWENEALGILEGAAHTHPHASEHGRAFEEGIWLIQQLLRGSKDLVRTELELVSSEDTRRRNLNNRIKYWEQMIGRAQASSQSREEKAARRDAEIKRAVIPPDHPLYVYGARSFDDFKYCTQRHSKALAAEADTKAQRPHPRFYFVVRTPKSRLERPYALDRATRTRRPMMPGETLLTSQSYLGTLYVCAEKFIEVRYYAPERLAGTPESRPFEQGDKDSSGRWVLRVPVPHSAEWMPYLGIPIVLGSSYDWSREVPDEALDVDHDTGALLPQRLPLPLCDTKTLIERGYDHTEPGGYMIINGTPCTLQMEESNPDYMILVRKKDTHYFLQYTGTNPASTMHVDTFSLRTDQIPSNCPEIVGERPRTSATHTRQRAQRDVAADVKTTARRNPEEEKPMEDDVEEEEEEDEEKHGEDDEEEEEEEEEDADDDGAAEEADDDGAAEEADDDGAAEEADDDGAAEAAEGDGVASAASAARRRRRKKYPHPLLLPKEGFDSVAETKTVGTLRPLVQAQMGGLVADRPWREAAYRLASRRVTATADKNIAATSDKRMLLTVKFYMHPFTLLVPAVVLFRAFGVVTFEEIYKLIGTFSPTEDIMRLTREDLEYACLQDDGIRTQADALVAIGRIRKLPTTTTLVDLRRQGEWLLRHRLFRHIDSTTASDARVMRQKVEFLAKLTYTLLAARLGYGPVTHRQSYESRRIVVMQETLLRTFAHANKKMREKLMSIVRTTQISSAIMESMLGIFERCTEGTHHMLTFKSVRHRVQNPGSNSSIRQFLEMKNAIVTLSLLSRISDKVSRNINRGVRNLDGSVIGLLCGIETPSGAKSGLTKQLSIVSRLSRAMTSEDTARLRAWICAREDVFEATPRTHGGNHVAIMLHGSWIGSVLGQSAAERLVDDLHLIKRTGGRSVGFVDIRSSAGQLLRTGDSWRHMSVSFCREARTVLINCTRGRVIRPCLILDKETSLPLIPTSLKQLWEANRQLVREGRNPVGISWSLPKTEQAIRERIELHRTWWRTLEVHACVVWLDASELSMMHVSASGACGPSVTVHASIYTRPSHCWLHPCDGFSPAALLLTLLEHSYVVRLINGTSAIKHAIGTPALAAPPLQGKHMRLVFPERAAVQGVVATDYLHMNTLPAVMNVGYALTDFFACNIEDGTEVSLASQQLGLGWMYMTKRTRMTAYATREHALAAVQQQLNLPGSLPDPSNDVGLDTAGAMPDMHSSLRFHALMCQLNRLSLSDPLLAAGEPLSVETLRVQQEKKAKAKQRALAASRGAETSAGFAPQEVSASYLFEDPRHQVRMSSDLYFRDDMTPKQREIALRDRHIDPATNVVRVGRKLHSGVTLVRRLIVNQNTVRAPSRTDDYLVTKRSGSDVKRQRAVSSSVSADELTLTPAASAGAGRVAVTTDEAREGMLKSYIRDYHNDWPGYWSDAVRFVPDQYNRVHVDLKLGKLHKLEYGDKLSNLEGQKGVVSELIPLGHMPWCAQTGIPYQVFRNPHSINSRRTVGQLISIFLGLFAVRHADYELQTTRRGAAQVSSFSREFVTNTAPELRHPVLDATFSPVLRELCLLYQHPVLTWLSHQQASRDTTSIVASWLKSVREKHPEGIDRVHLRALARTLELCIRQQAHAWTRTGRALRTGAETAQAAAALWTSDLVTLLTTHFGLLQETVASLRPHLLGYYTRQMTVHVQTHLERARWTRDRKAVLEHVFALAVDEFCAAQRSLGSLQAQKLALAMHKSWTDSNMLESMRQTLLHSTTTQLHSGLSGERMPTRHAAGVLVVVSPGKVAETELHIGDGSVSMIDHTLVRSTTGNAPGRFGFMEKDGLTQHGAMLPLMFCLVQQSVDSGLHSCVCGGKAFYNKTRRYAMCMRCHKGRGVRLIPGFPSTLNRIGEFLGFLNCHMIFHLKETPEKQQQVLARALE